MTNTIRSWGFKEETQKKIIDIIEENAITDENLGDLTMELIKELLPQIGIRMEFLKKWNAAFSKNTDEANPHINDENLLPKSLCDTNSDDNVVQHENALIGKYSFALKTKNLEVKAILKNNARGKIILTTYNASNLLDRKSRNIIVDVILTELMNEISYLSNDDFQYLAQEIIKIFPTETTAIYFIPAIGKRASLSGKSVISRGKLVDRYRNKLRELKKIGCNPRTSRSFSEPDEEPIDPVDDDSTREICAWLKDHSSPWDVVVDKWTATVRYRHREIKLKNVKTLCEIFDDWPILKQPNASSLIEADYEYLNFPTAKLTIEKWSEFFSKLESLYSIKRGDDNARTLIELRDIPREVALDDSSRVAIELRLLAHLFPPKGRIRSKKAQWKPSIPECKNSIIIGTALLADITKIQNDRRKEAEDRGTTLQPYIVVVGPSIDVVQNSFVVVDNTVYEIPSTIAAIDLCYKIFQVFDLKYPIESAHLWLLFQRVLYNYSSDADPAFPQISEAIADLKTLDSQS